MFSVNTQITGKNGLSNLSIPRAISTWESEVAPAVLAEIRRRAPVSTSENGGRLRDSISMTRRSTGGGIEARFVSSAPYARFVEEGTAPHRIEARSARALHWTTKGESAFAPAVNHPGTRANPFVRGAIAALLPMMTQKLRDRTQEEFQS